MKTLKVALLVTTAAGAVAAGGVTYATVGNSSPAPSAQAAKDAAVAKHAPAVNAPAAPAVPSVPTCVPDLPKGKALEKARAAVEQQIKQLAARAPQTPVTLPAAPGSVPEVVPAGELAKLPVGKLPTCKADLKGKPVAPPKLPAKPGLPALPALPAAVSCHSVPMVIKNEEARAKEFSLPNGMQVGASHAHKIVVRSRAACVYTQEFVGGLGKMITVDRIQAPPQVTLAQLARSLKMPGKFVSVSGIDTWTSPANEGMLWYSNQGYAIRVAGTNPAAAALVPGIASQLRTQ